MAFPEAEDREKLRDAGTASMRVLHVAPSFYPATFWGGPIHSVKALCDEIARRSDVELRVLTTDSSGPTTVDRLRPYEIDGVQFPYKVIFSRKTWGAEPSVGLLLRIFPMVAWADLVHLTGTYSFPTIPTLVACRVLRKPLVWSPRGALQRWHGGRREMLKSAWERVCALVMPRSRTVLHVTSQTEGIASKARFPDVDVIVVPNGVDIPQAQVGRVWMPGRIIRLIYLGRLHPIKGIENLLEAVALLDSIPFSLRICGDGDPRYVAQLKERCVALGIDDRTSFLGHIDGERKKAEFLSSDLCIVPSFSESFGMVVVESLAHGVPVIASKGTPWSDIEANGCGLWCENKPASLATAIAELAAKDLSEMGRLGRQWMARSYSWKAVTNSMITAYWRMVAGRPRS